MIVRKYISEEQYKEEAVKGFFGITTVVKKYKKEVEVDTEAAEFLATLRRKDVISVTEGYITHVNHGGGWREKYYSIWYDDGKPSPADIEQQNKEHEYWDERASEGSGFIRE